jgi:DNA primase
MTEHQGLPFMDAVKELAVLASMDMPAPDPRAAQRAEVAKTLHDTMAAAQDFFVRNLAGDGGRHRRRGQHVLAGRRPGRGAHG